MSGIETGILTPEKYRADHGRRLQGDSLLAARGLHALHLRSNLREHDNYSHTHPGLDTALAYRYAVDLKDIKELRDSDDGILVVTFTVDGADMSSGGLLRALRRSPKVRGHFDEDGDVRPWQSPGLPRVDGEGAISGYLLAPPTESQAEASVAQTQQAATDAPVAGVVVPSEASLGDVAREVSGLNLPL